jgi:O-Antigen ligase
MPQPAGPLAIAPARALRYPPVWFLLAMVSAGTARYALPLLVVMALWAAWRGELDLSSNLDAIEWGIFIFAAAWIASSAFALDPTRSFLLSIPMLAALTSLFVLRRERDADQALMSFDVVLFLLGFWQCLQVARAVLAGFSGEAAIQQSAALWLVEPNDIAWIAGTWPPLLAMRTGGRRVLLAIPVALGLVLMIALGSRLALIVSLFALAPMLTRTPMKTFALALAMAAMFSLVALFVDPAIFDKGSASLATRLQLWHTAWQVFFDWPWLGTGPHGFALAYTHYLPPELALDPRDTPWPHSLPLEIAAVTGLAGIFASGLLIFAAYLHSRTGPALDPERRRVVLVQCVVFVVLGLFEASFLRLWVWMLATSILCRLPHRTPATSDFSLP